MVFYNDKTEEKNDKENDIDACCGVFTASKGRCIVHEQGFHQSRDEVLYEEHAFRL